ncbi:unnamed protein product [Linum tenue]|uniref:DYW domain-containing protein n=1 Tax=Linum tenue TaxID=586396 RepID=A0AAV0JSD0_9ROSI|nr:unnamed protein product [Linum tenue]
MDHYACMVDLLGRSGHLNEAMEFINTIPFKPDPLVLRTLLGACQVHKNTDLGKHVANMIIEQDPDDPAAYVLLSNLYASAGEEKEKYLLQHSEKIAVAFGFIGSVGSSKPVRVFKNLRICGDCHSAFKYFSVARAREIVVRDSNRFHHFRNGSCSCNDHW